jgi:hypothetical protein
MIALLQSANRELGPIRRNRALWLGSVLVSAIFGIGKATWRPFPPCSSKPVLKKDHNELAWEK